MTNMDAILDGEAEVPMAVVTPSFLLELTDRFLSRVSAAVMNLHASYDRPDPEDEDAYDAEAEYQAAFQETGRELLPSMEAMARVVLSAPLPVGLVILERIARSQPMMTYWGYMRQHTNIDEFQSRMDG